MHRLSHDPQFANVTLFKLDFDSGKRYLREFRVQWQSTLIAFKGKVERARSVAEVEPDEIRKVFEAAL